MLHHWMQSHEESTKPTPGSHAQMEFRPMVDPFPAEDPHRVFTDSTPQRVNVPDAQDQVPPALGGQVSLLGNASPLKELPHNFARGCDDGRGDIKRL
jgi:hypothetical protein